MKKYLITALLALLTTSIYCLAQSKTASDQNTKIPKPYAFESRAAYDGLTIETGYLEMRDGVRIAYDLYLPKGWRGEALPTLVHQTRYWRAPDLRWPFSMFSDGLIGQAGAMIKDIVNQGYAIVNVDARGSGASFGSRAYPWTEDETKDGAEMIDWIIVQEWSNGNVGSMGVSYSGTTAEFLSFNQHPNLKAVVLMFSLYDVYEDIAYPGGVFHEFFVNNWGRFNAKLDENKLPRGGLLAHALVKGVRRSEAEQKRKTFKSALEDHQENVNVDQIARGVQYRDQIFNEKNETVDVFSPHTYSEKINNCETAVYCYSGWWDGDYQHAAVKRYMNLSNPQNKLLLGPWEHGGQYNCSPANPSKSGFSHVGEILKFFDFHLKGVENGLSEEAPVHYFTMNEEAWKSANIWPPESTATKLYLGDQNQLSFNAPTEATAADSYQVDTTARTGDHSRWKSLIGMLDTPHVYPDRELQDQKLLCYDSPVLESDLLISGHPIIKLYLSSDQTDGNFHVYLEELKADGSVNLITEGLLRGIHRKLSEEGPLERDAVPQRNYFESDIAPLVPGEVSELIFDLLPTSFLFKKGSRIRIALAGADQSHFRLMHDSKPNWKVYRNAEYPSHIVLPVVDTQND